MELGDIAACLTWANQNDPLITIDEHDVRFKQWEAGLGHVRATAQQACAIISAYYGNTEPGRDGRIPSITPRIIRDRITNAKETADASRRAALPPGRTVKSPMAFRHRDPNAWDAAYNQGRVTRADRIARKGGNPTPRGFNSQELDEWAAITGHTPTR